MRGILSGSYEQGVQYLPAVVEIPVGVVLQLFQLLHLVEHLMDVELGHEELQTTVAVRLTAIPREKHLILIHSFIVRCFFLTKI